MSKGYDVSRLEFLHSFLKREIDKKAIYGGIYAIAQDGELIAADALGKQSFRDKDKRKLKPDAIFRIASITKLFTAAAVFQLVENGLCRLDEPMKNYLPEMDNEDFSSVTIAQALSHTGGLPVDEGVYPEDGKPGAWELIGQEFADGGTDWVTAGLGVGRTVGQGTCWEYSSFGYSLLGEMVSRISGTHVHTYIEENILKPCGMVDSGFWNTIINHPDFSKRTVVYFEEMEESLKDLQPNTSPRAMIPKTGGGIYSTVADLVKFGNMLLSGGEIGGKRVLGRKAIEKMTARYCDLPNYCWGAGGTPKYYGLGPDLSLGDLFLDSPGTYYHEGWGRCRLSMDPKEHFVSAYYLPLVTHEWDPIHAYNTQAILCSGLK
ncbi:MAG: beta-lactamase family protein [Oscillospiraceae bacterium]|nr:beta-lactamase family protein [Oscillospiraceae bacterium]